MLIGEKLKELRTKKNLTLKQMGEILGVSHMTYQRYEKNDTDVSTEMLSKLADFYGVTTDYLLGREPPTNPLAQLGITIHDISDDEFIRRYRNLSEDGRKLFLNVMRMLTEGTVIDVENDSDGDVIYQGETVYENADDETEESRLA